MCKIGRDEAPPCLVSVGISDAGLFFLRAQHTKQKKLL